MKTTGIVHAVCPDLEDDAPDPPEPSRLPPGRHGLPRDFVVENQRERLIVALAVVMTRKGYDGATITDITRQAAVSRRTFYEHFGGKDECFVAALDLVTEELRRRVEEAFRGEDDWAEGIRAGIGAMVAFLSSEPELAHLGMVEPLIAGPLVLERYDAAVRLLIPYLKAGREGLAKEGRDRLPDLTEQALAGGMVTLISRRIAAGRTDTLKSLLPDLVEFALIPYLGNEHAARIARD